MPLAGTWIRVTCFFVVKLRIHRSSDSPGSQCPRSLDGRKFSNGL